MKTGLVLKIAAIVVPLLAVGCGGLGTSDGGTFDGGTTGPCPGVPQVFALGSGGYTVTNFSITDDGCQIMPDPNTLKGTTRQVTYNSQTGVVSVAGSEATADILGMGPVTCNTGTLKLDAKQTTDGAGCSYTLQRVSIVRVVDNSDFTLDFTESQTNKIGTCMPKTDCTSHFMWELKR